MPKIVTSYVDVPPSGYTKQYASYTDIHTELAVTVGSDQFGTGSAFRAWTHANQGLISTETKVSPEMLPYMEGLSPVISSEGDNTLSYDLMITEALRVAYNTVEFAPVLVEIASYFEMGPSSQGYADSLPAYVEVVVPYTDIAKLSDIQSTCISALYMEAQIRPSGTAPDSYTFVDNIRPLGPTAINLQNYYDPLIGHPSAPTRNYFVGFLVNTKQRVAASTLTPADVVFGWLVQGTSARLCVNKAVVVTKTIVNTAGAPEIIFEFTGTENASNPDYVSIDLVDSYVYVNSAAFDPGTLVSGTYAINFAGSVLAAISDANYTGLDGYNFALAYNTGVGIRGILYDAPNYWTNREKTRGLV